MSCPLIGTPSKRVAMAATVKAFPVPVLPLSVFSLSSVGTFSPVLTLFANPSPEVSLDTLHEFCPYTLS